MLFSRQWLALLLMVSSLVYVASVVGIWVLLIFQAERWWLATLLLFGPRWVYALPLAVLVPAASVWQRWLLGPLALAAAVVVGPIMGFNVPWQTLGAHGRADLRVLSYNIDRWSVDAEDFSVMLETLEPDLVAIQEYPSRRWALPEGWYIRRAGELVVLSAHPIVQTEVSRNRWSLRGQPYVNGLYCVVETPWGRVGFASIHLKTPRPALSAVLDRETIVDLEQTDFATRGIRRRWRESEDMARWLSGFPEAKIVAGDFNMPSDSAIYRNYWRGYRNAFQRAGWGFGYTKQTVIRGWQYGTRIDHILTGGTWHATRCWLGPDLGSDHYPLIADLAGSRAAGRVPSNGD